MLSRTLLPLAFLAHAAVAAQFTVAQDGTGEFNGADEKPIVAAIAKARAAGGGEILIRTGTYLFTQGITVKDAKNLRFRGEPGTVLKLPPLQHAETSTDAAVGDREVSVRFQHGFAKGVRARFMAPGEVDAFSQKAKPTFWITLTGAETGKLLLEKPLAFPVPAGTRIINEEGPNLFEVRGASENISFRDLTIDGGRVEKDPPVSGHAQLCGIFAAGAYSYTDGPQGPPVTRIEIRDCIIRNCFGRGVAFYSVKEGLIANCSITDTVDEAIDFDHFAVACRAVDNDVARCATGVEMNDANDCWVARNRFTDCNVGINLWRWCKMPDLNTRNLIVDNLFIRMKANGINLGANTALNQVRGNIIRESGRNGISVNGRGAMVSENLVAGAGMHGIVVSGEQNEIDRNHIVDAALTSAGQADGIFLSGVKNRALDNFIGTEASEPKYRKPLTDGGKENIVREPGAR